MSWKVENPPSPKPRPLHIRMTKLPTVRAVPFDELAEDYGAYDIRNALAKFVAKSNKPALSGARLELAASRVVLFFNKLPVFHKVRFSNPNPQEWLECEDVQDVAHAKPAWVNPQHRHVPARFDTVLVNCGNGELFGVSGMPHPTSVPFPSC